MDYFNKRYHAPGTPPGTLVPTQAGPALTMTLTDYNSSEILEKSLSDSREALSFLARDTITWIDIRGDLDTASIMALREMFDLHTLALEDVVNTGQRTKAESYDDQLFIILNIPVLDGEEIHIEQVSLFLGPDFVISFHNASRDIFSAIRKRLHSNVGRVRKRPACYLLYTLIDIIIDEGFPILEQFGELLESLEEKLLDRPNDKALHTLHQYKRELLLLRRNIWPQREAVNILLRDNHPLIDNDTRIYLRDCYDHTVQIMELLESYRDISNGLLDLYLSSTSYRMNQSMRVLTVIATIFIPLTFIAGVYGMNFRNPDSPWSMPELGWYYGYPIIWGVMITVALFLLYLFKRKKWF